VFQPDARGDGHEAAYTVPIVHVFSAPGLSAARPLACAASIPSIYNVRVPLVNVAARWWGIVQLGEKEDLTVLVVPVYAPAYTYPELST
jgi:hypothetical protein